MKQSLPVLIGKRLLLSVYALFALFPLVWMVIMSLKTQSEVLTTGFVFHPTFENYVSVATQGDYGLSFRNNLIVSIGAVLLSLVVAFPPPTRWPASNLKARRTSPLPSCRFASRPKCS